jgi:hypothetical protein
MNQATSFPVARYRFEFQARQPIRLPDYSGSMLRGAFGHALRQLACMTRQKDCAGCPLIGSCPYPAIFAPPPPVTHRLQKFSQIPAPYVIEPPAWGSRVLAAGETLTFHQVLIGRALQELPLIILAWRRALARGVGAGDGTADLVRVVHCGEAGDEEIHRPEVGTITAHAPLISLAGQTDNSMTSAATLRFDTPLRLQQNGRALPPEKLQARTLLMALARRASLLAEFHAGTGSAGGRFRSAERYLCRHPRGEKPDLARLDPLLVATAAEDEPRWRSRHLAARRSPRAVFHCCNSGNGCTSARKPPSG